MTPYKYLHFWWIMISRCCRHKNWIFLFCKKQSGANYFTPDRPLLRIKIYNLINHIGSIPIVLSQRPFSVGKKAPNYACSKAVPYLKNSTVWLWPTSKIKYYDLFFLLVLTIIKTYQVTYIFWINMYLCYII